MHFTCCDLLPLVAAIDILELFVVLGQDFYFGELVFGGGATFGRFLCYVF